MTDHTAPGLTADWLNAWLAAIGVTVLLPDVRLRWTDDPLPKAVFAQPDGSDPLPDRIAAALPTVEDVDALVIADLPSKLTAETYPLAAARARLGRDSSLALTTTDLGSAAKDGTYPKAPFDPPVPAGRTFAWRLIQTLASLDRTGVRVETTLNGTAPREPGNGLAFDYRRLGTGRTDPVVEVLAFAGLQLLPVRGDGHRTRQRGWTGGVMQPHSFQWPIWEPPIDRWGIDALLDIAYSMSGRPPVRQHRVGITGTFGSMPYLTAQADPTRGYASERLW